MPKAETRFELEKMLTELTDAFLVASKELRKEFDKPDWAESPFIYHMPKMTVSMQVALSYSGEKVSGNFITGKKSSKEESELVTTIDIDVVSVPRMAEGPPPAEARTRIPPRESGNGSTEGPAASGEAGNDDEPPPEKPGNGAHEEPAPPPMPTGDASLKGNLSQGGVKKRLENLGFTKVRFRKETSGVFEFRATWQTQARTIRVNTGTGAIEETGG